MIIRSPEPEVKILVDRDPIKTSFEEWARPGHFSRTIAKGPDTTTWIWNLHADAHDFKSLQSAFEIAKQTKGKPSAIIAKSVKGKGVTFMENLASWHGTAPNDEQYVQAMEELDNIGKNL